MSIFLDLAIYGYVSHIKHVLQQNFCNLNILIYNDHWGCTEYNSLLLVWEESMIGCPRASRTTSLTTSPWSRSSCSIALQTIETDSCPNLSRSSVRLIEIGNSMTICPSSSREENVKSFTKFICFFFLDLINEKPGAGRFPNPALVTGGLRTRLRPLIDGRELDARLLL